MARPTGHVFAATSSQVSGRVRGAGVPASAASIARRQGLPVGSVGWVVHSDSSHIDSAGFPRPVPLGVRPGRGRFSCPAALPFNVMQQIDESPSSSRSIGKTVLAGLVVLVAGYILLKIVIGIAVAIAGTIAVILAIVAIIWALRVLL
jgi:hypothetical protein